MRQHARLSQRIVHQPALGQLQSLALAAVQHQSQMATQEPFVEQAGIALQQRFAELPHAGGRGDRLQPQQLLQRGIEPGVRVVLADHMRQGRTAQVLQQQEAVLDVDGEHLRYAHIAAHQQFAHGQPGTDILQARRRVHHDASGTIAQAAPVAAEAGVHRRAFQLCVGVAERAARPLQAVGATPGRVLNRRVHAVGGGHRRQRATG